MRIFVTGATGFVGKNLLNWLVQHQPEAAITCLVRDPAKASVQWPKQPQNVTFLPGNLLEPNTYEEALLGAELVFHTAALVSLKNGPEFYTQNTDATRHLLEALGYSNRLQRLVFTGSISAVDRPLDRPAVGPLTEESVPHPNTDYGKSKLEAEKLIMTAGVPYCILRPAYIYGPYPRPNSSMDRLMYDVHQQKHYTRFPFPGRASEIYVEDLAEMLWIASQHEAARNRIFFVANPEPVSICDVYPALAQALGVPYQPMDVPPESIPRYQRMLYRRYPDNLLLRILFEDYFYCDPSAWYHAIGYQPRYGYEEGLHRTVAWYRQHGLI